MKRLIAFLCTLAIFAIPSVASAHTGTVTCDSRGVVFTYNANFSRDTTTTENVNGVIKTFIVRANVVSTDVIASNQFTTPIVASSNWGFGSIPATTVVCPPKPPTPPTPKPPAPPAPPVCPVNTVNEGVSNGVLICVRTITNTLPAPPPITVTVIKTIPESPEEKAPKCPKGTKHYHTYGSAVICVKRHVVVRHSVKMVPYKPFTAPAKHGVGGVAG